MNYTCIQDLVEQVPKAEDLSADDLWREPFFQDLWADADMSDVCLYLRGDVYTNLPDWVKNNMPNVWDR